MYGMCETSKKWANHIPLYSIQLAFGAWRPTPFWGTVKNLSYLPDLLLHAVPMIRYAFGIWAVKWQTIQFTSKLSTRALTIQHVRKHAQQHVNTLVSQHARQWFAKTRWSIMASVFRKHAYQHAFQSKCAKTRCWTRASINMYAKTRWSTRESVNMRNAWHIGFYS